MANSPFGTSKGGKAAAYERPASVQTKAPVDDESPTPVSPSRNYYGEPAQGTGGSDASKIH